MINIDLTNFQRIENVNEMRYFNPGHTDYFYILASGTYKWYNFKIYSRGYYPSIYIRIGDRERFIDRKPMIDVHGGIILDKMVLHSLHLENGCRWIGWEYNVAGDALGDNDGGKRYTTEELLNDMMAAVDQLVSL